MKFGHKFNKQRDQPHEHIEPTYGETIQYEKQEDLTLELDKEGKTFIQQVLGTFLYNARAVDPTMLMALNAIATEQSKPTRKTMEKTYSFWTMWQVIQTQC